MTMLVYIEQHLNNIWISIHEKIKQHWAELKESVAYKKCVYIDGYNWWKFGVENSNHTIIG